MGREILCMVKSYSDTVCASMQKVAASNSVYGETKIFPFLENQRRYFWIDLAIPWSMFLVYQSSMKHDETRVPNLHLFQTFCQACNCHTKCRSHGITFQNGLSLYLKIYFIQGQKGDELFHFFLYRFLQRMWVCIPWIWNILAAVAF